MDRLPLDRLLSSPSEAARLAAILRGGGLAGIPTETFYGLAADPFSEEGVRRALALKGRDASRPLLVLFAERGQLDPFGIAASPERLERFFAIWPAPLTVVLALAAPIPASCGRRSLGVRIPAHLGLRELLRQTGPVTGTSLNRSGEPPCEEPREAARRFSGELDALVDGGRCPGGLPSTLLDATVEPPRVLRSGAFPWPAAAS
jgi:L-threonylcarbamoyladenylate synthase